MNRADIFQVMLPISNLPHKEAELNLQLALSELLHKGPHSYGVTVISNLSPDLFFFSYLLQERTSEIEK